MKQLMMGNPMALAAANQAKKLLQAQPEQCKLIWRAMEALRHSEPTLWWPDWCFVPHSVILGPTNAPRDRKLIAASVMARILGTWRVTQGVYAFDEEIYEHVTSTEQAGQIPVEVLLHLPEWCIYVPTPGASFRGYAQFGFFALLDWDHRSDAVLELMMLTDTTIEVVRLHLMNGASLHECITKSAAFARDGVLPPTTVQLKKLTQDHDELVQMLNLLLFICSQAAEIGDGVAPPKPAPTRTKKGMRYFPPHSMTVWPVGSRLGAKLRTALANNAAHPGDLAQNGGVKRPHIRRAHWHGYWVGPRNSELRALDLRWMPPIAVNVDDVEHLIATVRPVCH